MKLVHMQTSQDCVIAGLAMFCEEEYRTVYHKFLQRTNRTIEENGTFKDETVPLANDLGKKIRKGWGKPRGRCLLIIHVSENDFNHPAACGGHEWYHAVYYDGVNIFDPDGKNSCPTCLTTEQYLQKVDHWYKERKWFL